MLKKIFKGAIIAAVALFASCTEDIDKSNRYTFTEETLQSYLQNRPEFSHLIDIFKRANMMGTLGTYGEHTLFAPTNAAIERYLFEQDSIWQATKDTEEPVWTGITSPYLEELSDSMANVIAKSHLIPEKYETIDMTWETMPTQNYNKRYISLNTSSDSNGYHIYIENKAEIVIGDELVENGVIHIVSHVVEQTTNTLYEHIASYPYFSIFAEAIERTGYDQTMLGYVDESYDLQFVEATPYRTYEGVSVDVLGTTFNMKSYSDAECVEVILLEGSVRFNVLDESHSNEMLMRPGNMLQYHRSTGTIDMDVFPKDKYKAFYNNRSIHFFNITLEDIATDLERLFCTKIVILNEELAMKKYFACFGNNESLDEILNAINADKKISMRKKEGVIYLK